MPIGAKNPWLHDIIPLNNKGLDLIHPIEQVGKDNYSRMEDVKSLQEGTITPRPGTSLVNSSAFETETFPQLDTNDSSGAASICVTSGSSNAFGTAVEFISSTASAIFWMTLSVGPFDDSHISRFVFEVRTGAGAGVKHCSFVTSSEASGGIKATDTAVLSFPVNIPISTRISIALKDLDSDSSKQRCFTMVVYG